MNIYYKFYKIYIYKSNPREIFLYFYIYLVKKKKGNKFIYIKYLIIIQINIFDIFLPDAKGSCPLPPPHIKDTFLRSRSCDVHIIYY